MKETLFSKTNETKDFHLRLRTTRCLNFHVVLIDRPGFCSFTPPSRLLQLLKPRANKPPRGTFWVVAVSFSSHLNRRVCLSGVGFDVR